MKKKIALILACLMVTTIFTVGCGKEEVKFDSMATFDGKKIDYDLVKFMASYQQAKTEKNLKESLGEGLWSVDYMADGVTLLDSVKDELMEKLQSMLVLEAHIKDYKVSISDVEKKKIEISAQEFMDNNSAELIKKTGASKEVIQRYLELYTIYYKMYTEIGKGADSTVEAADIKQKKISYVVFSYYTGKTKADGTKEKLSNKDIALLSTKAKEVREKAIADFEGTMKTENMEIKTKNYGNSVEDIAGLDDQLIRAAERLSQEGDISGLVEGADGYYIVRLDKLNDEEASAAKKEEILNERKETFYQAELKKLIEKHEFIINTKAWNTIQFEDPLTTKE